jgi:hypothetical protein
MNAAEMFQKACEIFHLADGVPAPYHLEMEARAEALILQAEALIARHAAKKAGRPARKAAAKAARRAARG